MKKVFLLATLLGSTSLISMAAKKPSTNKIADKVSVVNKRIADGTLICTTVHACGGMGGACGYGQEELAYAAGVTALLLCMEPH